MLLTNFFINVLIRVTFIVITSVLMGIVLQHINEGYYYTITSLIFLIMIQAYMLVQKVNKTNTDLEKFFSSVHDHDSSIRFQGKVHNKSFEKLHDSMNDLNAIIQHAKIDNERTTHYLQSLVDHVDTGLLCFDLNGRIDIYNRAAEKYLLTGQLQQLSALKSKDSALFSILNDIRPGQKILHKLKTGNQQSSILIKASELKFESNIIKLVSFQDITFELEKKEMDSWQKIIRILTHEIMNAVSPVTSLSAVISGYFKRKDTQGPVKPEEINQQVITKTLTGLETIEETGKGLLKFVENYRSLTSMPNPGLNAFEVNKLFGKCKLLMESNISKNTSIDVYVFPEDLMLVADFAQIEQVLINLIRNSVDAISDEKAGIITLKAFRSNEDILIRVEDNGTGIPEDTMDNIFVPFFTTKKNGSGIGLSLSKQIMQNHNGTISVSSRPNENTVFTLKFPHI